MMASPGTDPFDLARAEVMLRGYHARWSDEHYEVVAVEAEFRAPLVNPETGAASRTWTLGGRLDVIVRELVEGRRLLLIEHKTSSEEIAPGSDYVKRLRLDGQVSIYYEGGGALGHHFDGCLYDILAKPRQRPLKATPRESRKYKTDGSLYANQRDQDETPEQFKARLVEAIAADPNSYFVRAEVVRLREEMDEARFDLWQLGRQLREAELAHRFPRNPDSCLRYGRTCEFFGVCTGEASLEDPALFRRSEVIHPELDSNADGRLLTASRLRDARACQRLHKHKYLDGYRPAVDAETLRFGKLMHRGLEAWWRAPDGERLEAGFAALNPATSVSTAA